MFRANALLRICSLLIWACFLAAPAEAAIHWTKLARHVGQNENEHARAVRELRKIKDLDSILLKALDTPQRHHALDVIGALKIQKMVPHLLERTSSDEDGFFILAINSLLSEENKELILDSYIENLSPDRPGVYSPGAIVAMLEPLGRLGIALSKPTLQALFEHPFPEVRSSALNYVRAFILRDAKSEYSSYVLKALKANPAQLRIQAVFLVEEMLQKPETAALIDLKAVDRICQTEKNENLKRKCLAITGDAGELGSLE